MKITAAILAGGESRRMGRDKANLPSLENFEITMLRRTVELASRVFDSVYVVGRPMPEDWESRDAAASFLPDESPNLGPAGGLETLLKFLTNDVSSENRAAALLACDMPLLDVPSLEWLYRKAQEGTGKHGLAVDNDGQIEPLFSVYTQDCLPLLSDQLAKGRRSLQRLIESGEFCVAAAPSDIARTLINVNTAEELAQVQSLAGTVPRDGTSIPALSKNP